MGTSDWIEIKEKLLQKKETVFWDSLIAFKLWRNIY